MKQLVLVVFPRSRSSSPRGCPAMGFVACTFRARGGIAAVVLGNGGHSPAVCCAGFHLQ